MYVSGCVSMCLYVSVYLCLHELTFMHVWAQDPKYRAVNEYQTL